MREPSTAGWLESITDAFPGIAYLVSRDGEILACRPGRNAAGQPDIDPSQLIGKRVDDLVPPNQIEKVCRCIERALDTDQVVSANLDVPDEHARTVAHRIMHYAGAADDRVAILTRDITPERTRDDAGRLVGELAVLLLSADPAKPEPVVREALRRVGEFVGATGVNVFSPKQRDDGYAQFEAGPEWTERGVAAVIPDAPVHRRGWTHQVVSDATGPTLLALDEVPESAAGARWVMEKYLLSAIGFIPVALGEPEPAFLSFGWLREPNRVDRARFQSLGAVGNLISTVLLRQLAEVSRHEADARLRSLTEQSHEVVVVLGADGTPTFLSPAVVPLSGRSAEELDSSEGLLGDVHPADRDSVMATFAESHSQPGVPIEFTFRSTPPNGSERRTVATIINLLGVAGVDGYVVNARDVTEQHHARAALERAASTDALTGLGNRAHLTAQLDAALERGDALAVVFIDVDHFKRVNDGYGHTLGDEVLIELGQRIREAVAGALVARFAGDGFAVMLTGDHDERSAIEVAARFRAAIAAPVVVSGRSLRLTASVGIAITPADSGATAEQLTRDADTALYEAKRRGRDTYVIADEGLRAAARERVELEAGLVRAVDEDELEVHFQPIVDMRTERRCGVEALVRWNRPGHGMVEPDAFIPIAEELGTIIHIDTWVLQTGLGLAAPWHHAHDAQISVNLSAHDLLNDGLAPTIMNALSAASLPAGSLCLEITETAYAHAPDDAIDTLQGLRSEGVHIAIDDFGSGYSSIDRVRRFPVDGLKIDRTLVEPILDSPGDLAAARAVTELAHSLGLRLTAEGVTTRDHHDALCALGCDAGQGYLYGRPVPAHELTW